MAENELLKMIFVNMRVLVSMNELSTYTKEGFINQHTADGTIEKIINRVLQ